MYVLNKSTLKTKRKSYFFYWLLPSSWVNTLYLTGARPGQDCNICKYLCIAAVCRIILFRIARKSMPSIPNTQYYNSIFSFFTENYPTIDVEHNSCKVNIYHVSPNNCGYAENELNFLEFRMNSLWKYFPCFLKINFFSNACLS